MVHFCNFCCISQEFITHIFEGYPSPHDDEQNERNRRDSDGKMTLRLESDSESDVASDFSFKTVSLSNTPSEHNYISENSAAQYDYLNASAAKNGLTDFISITAESPVSSVMTDIDLDATDSSHGNLISRFESSVQVNDERPCSANNNPHF